VTLTRQITIRRTPKRPETSGRAAASRIANITSGTGAHLQRADDEQSGPAEISGGDSDDDLAPTEYDPDDRAERDAEQDAYVERQVQALHRGTMGPDEPRGEVLASVARALEPQTRADQGHRVERR
jgi:hypothetical protein